MSLGMAELLMSIDLYEVRPRKDRRGFDLISDALPFGPLWYSGPNAIGYAIHPSRSHPAVIRFDRKRESRDCVKPSLYGHCCCCGRGRVSEILAILLIWIVNPA